MSVWEGIVLGIIQGLTEFIPVSSSGHLVLFQNLFGIEENAMAFNLAVHLATLIAVFVVYYQDLYMLIQKPFSRYVRLLVVGTIPAVIVGALFKSWLTGLFETGQSLGPAFLFTAIMLWLSSRVSKGTKSMENGKYKDAWLIGCAQAVALFPGVSRSGMTITTSLFRKLNPKEAARFSFLLSIPAILGAILFDVYETLRAGQSLIPSEELMAFGAGFIAAGLSGYLAIRVMIRFISKGKLNYISYYVFILAILVIIDQLFFGHVVPKWF